MAGQSEEDEEDSRDARVNEEPSHGRELDARLTWFGMGKKESRPGWPRP